MKRLAGTLVALVVLAVGISFPALVWGYGSEGGSTYEPTSISKYLADFTVNEDGALDVVETITVEFGPASDRHGIFRFFDRADPNAPGQRRVPQDIRVTMDGRVEPFRMETREHGRYDVARIGSASTTIQGAHTYEISYRIDDVLLADDDGSRFYWNLIPGGWLQRIDSARLRVHLPADAGAVRCAVGPGDGGACEIRGEGTNKVVVKAQNLPANTPVTLETRLPIPAPEPAEVKYWSPRWDPVLGSNLELVLLVLAAGIAAAALALLAVRSTFESKPQYPLMYAPPAGLGPAQGHYLLTERVGDNALVASLMQAAEKGAVTLDRRDEEWTITDRADQSAAERLDSVTRGAISALGLKHGQHFSASRKSVAAGKTLQAATSRVESNTASWALSTGLMGKSGLGTLGSILVIGAAMVAGLIVVFNPLGLSVLAVVPGAFAACGVGLFATGSSTRRTAKGRELWSQVGGFRRVLSTPSSEQRFDFSGRKELYTAYLPWAVAFGVADEWADKYRTEMGAEPPAPSYLMGSYVGSHTANAVHQMIGDFDATVDSAISSYEATQRASSSSSGGGGFSGGGGGGGGGGGSW